MANAKTPPLVHRTQILNAARHLFATQGYAETTTRMLNAQLDDAAGLLYYYFPRGKRQLLDAILACGAQWPLPVFDWQLQNVHTADAAAAQIAAGFADLWTIMLTPAHLETIMILIRERNLLARDQTVWLQRRYAAVASALQAALEAAGCPLVARQAPLIAETIMALFQKRIFDAILVENTVPSMGEFTAQFAPRVRALLVSVGSESLS